MTKIICKSEKDTQKLASEIANNLKGGEIIALQGDLGAGKTTFTQYLAKELRVKNQITSPTFVLMKIYPTKNLKSEIKNLIHVDCYRLDEPQELFYLGIEEYLNENNSIVVIEWADKIEKYLKNFEKVQWIKIIIKEQKRQFFITPIDRIK